MEKGVLVFEKLNIVGILQNKILPKYSEKQLDVQYMHLVDVPKI